MSITGGFRFAVRIVGMNTRQAENHFNEIQSSNFLMSNRTRPKVSEVGPQRRPIGRNIKTGIQTDRYTRNKE